MEVVQRVEKYDGRVLAFKGHGWGESCGKDGLSDDEVEQGRFAGGGRVVSGWRRDELKDGRVEAAWAQRVQFGNCKAYLAGYRLKLTEQLDNLLPGQISVAINK